ncbi:MAG: aminopeptidase [Proteobacteria bacterium]|nr:aminopeptidase [Pseudomonadota bacterium]
MNYQRIKRNCLICCLMLGSTSCATTSYYLQSLNGHVDLLLKRQPISGILASQNTDKLLRDKLEMVLEIRRFASEHLGLPDNGSYSDYADLGRNFVVWNVFAAPELSLQAKQWCFLFVGCLNYRGYYSEEAANRYAQTLEAQGHDVFVGGVTAYSTLGWFNDPVLNTMLNRDNNYLASVIFHELSHQKFYLKNDTAFNEAFAEMVAQTGVQYWLNLHGTAASRQKFLDKRSDETSFVNLILKYKEKLEMTYNSEISTDEKRANKKFLLNQLAEEYKNQYETGGNSGRYITWLSSGLNNAKLTSVITYQDYVSGFLTIFNHEHGNYQKFYGSVEKLSKCDKFRRKSILEDKITEFQC